MSHALKKKEKKKETTIICFKKSSLRFPKISIPFLTRGIHLWLIYLKKKKKKKILHQDFQKSCIHFKLRKFGFASFK